MKVTIFDLGENTENESLIQALENDYKKIRKETSKETEVMVYHSPETKIKNCIGCWSCWWKTPGKCALKDDAYQLYKDYINSDEVILLFHTENGFINGNGKTFLDRLIQHFMPYIKLRNGECCHVKRYDKYPTMKFYFNKDALSPDEEKVVRNYLARTAYHFQSLCKELLIENETIHTESLEVTKPTEDVLAKEITERKPSGKWVIYNGSPRGNHSNSLIIIEKIMTGMKAQGIEDIEVRNLIQEEEHKTWTENFSSVENHLFVFPLYVHAMPGSVMKFFEQIKPVNNKEIHMAFLVQSGFPETSQSYYLRPYLELLTKRLGVSFDGTIIKGGIEGIQMKDEKQNKKFFDQMELVGRTYASDGIMDVKLKKEYEKAAHLSKGTQILFSIFALTGLTNFYWNYNLKKNGAYDERFAKPYIE